MERDLILERLRERIVRFVASRIGTAANAPVALAEDIAQEVMLVLHEKYPELDRAEDLVPLSMEIARFKLMAARRKSVRRGENTQVPVEEIPLPSEGLDPHQEAERNELADRLESALGELNGRCRELFRLKLDGWSFAEIQQRMEADSINTVYTWDFRCRKRLKERMSAQENSLHKGGKGNGEAR